MKRVEFTYVRHGKTEFNRDGIIQGGRVDSPLDPASVATVEATARHLANRHFSACYASPLGRVQQTARIVAAPHDLPIIPLDDLREFDFGDIDGLPYAGNRLRFAWRYLNQDFSRANHGGESGREVRARVRRAFTAMYDAANDGDDVLVVAHGALFRYALLEFSDDPYPLRKVISEVVRVPNASVATIEATDGAFKLTSLPVRDWV